MESYPNIDRSGVHRNEYVGYGGGKVWRIKSSKTLSSIYPIWIATCEEKGCIETLTAKSFPEMNEKLGNLK